MLLISGSAKSALTMSCASQYNLHIGDSSPTYLTVVKGALHGDVVNVGVQHRGHLSLLNGADLALGVHDEHADVLLASKTIDSSRAGVTASRANNGQVFPLFAGLILALVPANEEVLEQVAQELQSNILEREGRAMEQLQQVEVLFLVEGCDGDNVVGTEGSIALSDNLLQIGFGDLIARDVEGEDLECEILEGKVPPFGLPVGWERGDFFGDEEATVGSEALQDDIFEGKLVISSQRKLQCKQACVDVCEMW